MSPNEVWREVQAMSGLTLHTLDRNNPFNVAKVTDSAVIIIPKSTGKERPISREGVERAYRHLVVTGRLSLDELENDFTPRNPVYTVAILARIPGVQYKLKPIRLLTSRE